MEVDKEWFFDTSYGKFTAPGLLEIIRKRDAALDLIRRQEKYVLILSQCFPTSFTDTAKKEADALLTETAKFLEDE